jgi:hypothetical protein
MVITPALGDDWGISCIYCKYLSYPIQLGGGIPRVIPLHWIWNGEWPHELRGEA